MASVVIKRTYPWTEKIQGTKFVFRLMTAADRDRMVALARRLPHVDVTFLRMDIQNPDVVDEWLENIEMGRTISVVAVVGENVVGYASLHHNEMTWTSHLGEIRVLVDPAYRSTGIGRLLAGEVFHIAREMRLDRVICQIPAAQTRVRQMLEQWGFQPEAMLPQWLKDRDGNLHDMLIMSQGMGDFGN